MALDTNKITELVERIHESGALGRSSTYPRLLDYLAEQAQSGLSCSEVDLAEKVFFKGESFDQTSDSSVRVYVHNLRKKLQLYYEREGRKEGQRIHIPKGEYRIEVVAADDYAKAVEGSLPHIQDQRGSNTANSEGRGKQKLWFGLAALILFISVTGFLFQYSLQSVQVEYSEEQLAFWGEILADDKPVLILLHNATGRFGVQSLSISSLADAENGSDSQSSLQAEVPDLLIRLVAMLGGINRPIEIGYLSEFSAEHVTGDSHIIYTDHVEGIERLSEIFGGVDQLEPTNLVSILASKKAEVLSSSHLSADDPRAKDYGLIYRERLRLPDSEEFEFVVLAGNGFTGQSAVVQIAQAQSVLTEMQLTEAEALSAGVSALFLVTASDGFHPQRTLLLSEAH